MMIDISTHTRTRVLVLCKRYLFYRLGVVTAFYCLTSCRAAHCTIKLDATHVCEERSQGLSWQSSDGFSAVVRRAQLERKKIFMVLRVFAKEFNVHLVFCSG